MERSRVHEERGRMKITYSGTNGELSPIEQKKIEKKFAKLSKVVEKRGEKGAHVVASKTRHLQKAEVTMNLRDHALVAVGTDGSLFNALSAAIENLEKQALKTQARARDTQRAGKAPAIPGEKVEREAPPTRIVKVTAHQKRKPMTLEEAILEMGDRTHYVYRGMESDRTTVIVRRADGHIDLIEG